MRVDALIDQMLHPSDRCVVSLAELSVETEVPLEGGIGDAAHVLNIIWQLLKLAAI